MESLKSDLMSLKAAGGESEQLEQQRTRKIEAILEAAVNDMNVACERPAGLTDLAYRIRHLNAVL